MSIVDPYRFTVKMDDGKLLEGVRERQVETVLPKRPGGRLVVVRGQHKGARGTLIERNRSANEVAVLLEEDQVAFTCGPDDAAELV